MESDDNTDSEMNNVQTNSMEGRVEAGSSGGVTAMNTNFHMNNSLYRISPEFNKSQEVSNGLCVFIMH